MQDAIIYLLGRAGHADAVADELAAAHPGLRFTLVTDEGEGTPEWALRKLPRQGIKRALGEAGLKRPGLFVLIITNEPRYLKPLTLAHAFLLSYTLRPRKRLTCLYAWSGRYTPREKIGEAFSKALGLVVRPFYLAGLRLAYFLGERIFPLVNRHPRNTPYSAAGLGRVLLMSLDLVGDLVWAGPAIASVKKSLPGVQVDLLVSTCNTELAKRMEGVDLVIGYDAPWLGKVNNPSGSAGLCVGWWRNIKTRLRLLSYGYDLVVDFRGEARNAVLAYLTGAPFRVGGGHRSTGSISASDTGYLLTHKFEADGRSHILDRHLALMRSAGFSAGPASGWLKMDVEDETRVGRLLDNAGAGIKKPLIGIQPGASRLEKRWSKDGFAEVADTLINKYGATVVIAGSRAEAPLCRYISEKTPGAIDLCGKTTLDEFAALIKMCDLFIANETSAISIASAMGTPLICLMTGVPELYGPYGVMHSVLQKKPDCYDPAPEHCFCPYNYRCLQEISPAEVMAAARTVLSARL